MKQGSFFLIVFLSILECAPTLKQTPTVMRDQTTSLEALSGSELATFEHNWKIAEEIVEQDRMAWIGTDSVLPRLNKSAFQSLRGYVVLGNTYNGDVCFYTVTEDSSVKIIASASFIGGRLMSVTRTYDNTDSLIIKSAICLQRAKAINMAYIKKQNVSYNSYSFYTDTAITVYLAPGSVNNSLIFGGGIKTVFDHKLNPVSTTELHKSIVVFQTDKMGEILFWSSSVTDVLNEIDIAQFLIWKSVVYNQMIATRKYLFSLYTIPDEGRIVKKAALNEKRE